MLDSVSCVSGSCASAAGAFQLTQHKRGGQVLSFFVCELRYDHIVMFLLRHIRLVRA